MNEPGAAALAPPHASDQPIGMRNARPHAVRLSGHPLGGARSTSSAARSLAEVREISPAGTTEHVIFVRLTDYYVRRESENETTDIGRSHLTRVFERTMGMSPHQYLVEARVHSARALLSSGGDRPSFAEVAAAVGFADRSHLTRQFKRILGTTPSKVRV